MVITHVQYCSGLDILGPGRVHKLLEVLWARSHSKIADVQARAISTGVFRAGMWRTGNYIGDLRGGLMWVYVTNREDDEVGRLY